MFQSDLFPAGEQLPSMPLAYAIGTRVAALLASGRHLTRTDISGLFAEETGSLDWGSAWTIADYNNAVEIGALLWLRESSRIDLATNVHEAEARFDWLQAAFPPRHVRSEAQVEPVLVERWEQFLDWQVNPEWAIEMRLKTLASRRSPLFSSSRKVNF